ncbi:MAG: amino acid adenylation domain-containing protein [Firmicutes bacterium]|nr:amino acid adenylation domain-containing protein [Bacillota bacterium]
MRFVEEIIDNQKDWLKIALIQNSRQLSYEDLRKNSYNMASILLNAEIQPNDRVIIFLEKSIEMIISILGTLKSGATYIPIDFGLPNDRIKYIISNCNPQIIITNSAGILKITQITGIESIKLLVIDSYDKNSHFSEANHKNLINWVYNDNPNFDQSKFQTSIQRTGKDIAYIIYTSGSTGKPKGVMIRHDSFTSFIQTITEAIGYYSEHTRYLSLFPFHFDGSLIDIFPTFLAGGTLILMEKFVLPNQLLSALEKYEITFTCMASTILKLLTSRFTNIRNYNLTKLEAIWYGTESCPVKVIHELKKYLPSIEFIQGYGPTEATCTTHIYFFKDIPENISGFFPIGKPLATVKAYALNESNEIIKPGEIGELYIGGIQIMEGYCNDEARTKEVFANDRFSKNEKVYKTGDYVTIDNEGNYIFIGRKDDMIKSCGKLIHLSEIENVLLAHDFIKDAIVLPFEDKLLITKMRAYIVFHEKKYMGKEELKDFILTKLPEYMVPHEFAFLNEDEIPRNSSGKIDRVKLLARIN